MKGKNPLLRKFYLDNLWLLLLNLFMLAGAGVIRTIGVGNVGRITREMENRDADALLAVVSLSIALISLSYVLRWAAGGLCMGLSNKLAALLRATLIKRLAHWNFQRYEEQDKGSLQSVISNDVNTATQVIYILHSRVLTNVFVYLTSAVYMIWIHIGMGIAIILVSLLLGVMNHFILNRIKNHEQTSKKALGEITNTIQHAFAGIDTIRSYNGYSFVKSSFLKEKRRYNASCMNTEAIDSWRLTFYNIISNTAFFATMFFLGAKAIRGEIDLEILLSFLMLLRQSMTPVEVILRWMTSLVRCDVSWKRIYDVLDSPAEDNSTPTQNLEPFRQMDARGMNFTYGGKDSHGIPVFRDLDIHLEKGTVTLLKGESGSGKTTLTKLLLGLYHSDDGLEKLYADGLEIPFGSLGASAAFAESSCPVFRMSVYENLHLGDPRITKDRCMALFRTLGFEEWLNSLPQGLDTVLDENGRNISGGQRQILSVMRAILADRPILILDEPFSALDQAHADILCDYLEQLKKEKFILLISHRQEPYQNNYAIAALGQR